MVKCSVVWRQCAALFEAVAFADNGCIYEHPRLFTAEERDGVMRTFVRNGYRINPKHWDCIRDEWDVAVETILTPMGAKS